MSKEFLDYYSDNLSFMRKLGAEFASEFPKIAARLDLNSLDCQDPFIERLLEGTAFLSARVEQKLEQGYPRLLEAILLSVCPTALAPIPSICAVKVSDGDLKSLQGNTQKIVFSKRFKKRIPNKVTEVCFETFFETDLHSMVISKSKILSHDLNIANLSPNDNHCALELSLSCVQGASFDSIDL